MFPSLKLLKQYVKRRFSVSPVTAPTEAATAPLDISIGVPTSATRPSKLEGNARLHVAAVYFNHRHFSNLLTNFQRFKKHMEDLGVTLYIVEVVLNDAPFEVSEEGNPYHVQLRTKYEMFHKENLINIGFRRAIDLHGEDAKYLAWIDTDLHFVNPTAIEDTIAQLQRHKVVQMWETAVDLDPTYRPLQHKDTKESVVQSFGYCYTQYGIKNRAAISYTTKWHPGYAYALRREVYEAMGGLYEISIMGSGDDQMAWAFAGDDKRGTHGAVTKSYGDESFKHLKRIREEVRGDLGYVQGLILHYWHGTKASRRYVERWNILVENKYDPLKDLIKREDGLLELTGDNVGLRDGIRKYFSLRNDDCNVTEEFFAPQKL